VGVSVGHGVIFFNVAVRVGERVDIVVPVVTAMLAGIVVGAVVIVVRPVETAVVVGCVIAFVVAESTSVNEDFV